MEIPVAVLVSLVLFLTTSLIGFVVWLIRLEGRINANKESISRQEKEMADQWRVIEDHRLNADIHFNLRVSNQVEQSNERRFLTIEKQLTEINQKLDRMAEKR